MRKTILLLCILGISGASFAQTNEASWAKLTRLQVGQKIQVAEMTSKKVAGTFVSVSDSTISLKDAAGDKTIQKQDVRSVKLMKSNRRLRNTLIGAGVGAGAGAGLTAAAWESRGWFGDKADGAAVGAILGGLFGAVVGVAVPSHDTIYSAGSH
jgi:outer membrane lipoprotein SlyB